MAFNFTVDQQKVIDSRDCNILVSAAAGSGKTAVLVERIIQMISNADKPVDIDRLLIVTFTKAAAAEMRERISLAIAAKLEVEPDNEHLQRQATLLHNAQITTIDSFCLFVLRNNFNDIGLDPGFGVADEDEVNLLKQDVMANLLERHFEAGTEEFGHCVEFFCPNGRESALEEHILALYQAASSHPWPRDWVEERKQDYAIETLEQLQETPWALNLTRHIQNMCQVHAKELKKAIDLAQEPDGPYMYGELLDKEFEQVEQLLQAKDLVSLESAFGKLVFDRLPGKKDESVNADKREAAQLLRKKAKEGLSKMAESYFGVPLLTEVEHAKMCQKPVGVLLNLCQEFMDDLAKAKADKNILDFSDMEHMALEILLDKTEDGVVPTATAREYRDYFEEVMIDEYQDSNLVQEYLLGAISGEEDGRFNRFMVGDVKQSIYRFRLARPKLFLEKYHTYEIDGAQEQCKSPCRRIDLRQNFRSRREVIDYVNYVFDHLMGADLGGIEYDCNAALYEGAKYPDNQGCETELLLAHRPEKTKSDEARKLEAMAIAAKIKELRKTFQVTDKATGQLRPVQYKDMVILLRSNSGWDDVFKKVLEAEGIPVYAASKTGYFATTEIQTVLQLLRVIDNPLQDIPLFGVLKSIFGGFSDQEIATLKCQNKDNYLYQNMREQSLMQGELAQKCQAFLKMLGSYRHLATYMPIRQFLQTIFGQWDYMHYVGAMPAGSQRLANVQMLLEKAGKFQKSSYYGLYHFIRYVEQLQKYEVDYGEANTLDEAADVVRIMSIHKSKGLEFPVTFVSGLAKKFNKQDTAKAVITDMDLGIGVKYVNVEQRTITDTLRKNAIAANMLAESIAEEIRVLYVALTRAKEKLILTGSADLTKLEVEELSREQQLGLEKVTYRNTGVMQEDAKFTYGETLAADGFIDWILPLTAEFTGYEFGDMDAAKLAQGMEEGQRLIALEHLEGKTDEQLLDTLMHNFEFVYPYQNLAGLYTKTTVTELKMAAMEDKDEGAFHAFENEEVVAYIPKFMKEEETVSGTTRGSAFHKVMELLDVVSLLSVEGDARKAAIYAQLNQMVQTGKLSEEYRKAISVRKIETFLEGELAKRMAKADAKKLVWREQPFVYGVPASRLEKEGQKFPEDEILLIQGIVDLFFEEDGQLVLVDYKTDVVEAPQALIDRYQTQIDYYQEALEKLTGKKVKERILYSFFFGQEVVL
ncbi:MAG: helicase-exonuclease AddAB subunit AddA [Lachnospiraceae bacterium]|nr:helicase-exonuclease AddAB subunit AddA [Lachnospiraceae bacterium]